MAAITGTNNGKRKRRSSEREEKEKQLGDRRQQQISRLNGESDCESINNKENARLIEKRLVDPNDKIISSFTSFSNAYVSSYVPPISLIQDLTQTDDLSPDCSIVGHLSFNSSNCNVNCANFGTMALDVNFVDKNAAMKNEGALFILLVGNKDTFRKLAINRFIDTFPCIIVSAKTQPSDETKKFLRMMKWELKLPVLALVDCDRVGMKILSVYTSLDLDIKWLGVRPSDLDKYNVPMDCKLEMTSRDVATGNKLLRNEIVKKNSGWLSELSLMMQMKKKVEVPALTALGLKFLLAVYLPLKLQEMDWI